MTTAITAATTTTMWHGRRSSAFVRCPSWAPRREYIDFGSGNGNNGYYGYGDYYANASSHPKAAVLYGIGYLPLPLPFLDVYGKAGVARLQTDITTYPIPGRWLLPAAVLRVHAPTAYRIDQWNDKFA